MERFPNCSLFVYHLSNICMAYGSTKWFSPYKGICPRPVEAAGFFSVEMLETLCEPLCGQAVKCHLFLFLYILFFVTENTEGI